MEPDPMSNENVSHNSSNTARDRGNIAIRIGKLYSTLPHCLRRLPENQPRNRQEYMIRKWMNPSEIEVYFDASNKYLYEARTMAQQMEEIKKDRRKLMETYHEQMKILKAVIVKEPPPPQMDIAAMRKRFDTAVKEHAKTKAKNREKQMSH